MDEPKKDNVIDFIKVRINSDNLDDKQKIPDIDNLSRILNNLDSFVDSEELNDILSRNYNFKSQLKIINTLIYKALLDYHLMINQNN